MFYCITTDERISIKRTKEIWIFISNIIEWTPFSEMTFFDKGFLYSREQFESNVINKKVLFLLTSYEFTCSWYLCRCKCVILMIIWKCYVSKCRIYLDITMSVLSDWIFMIIVKCCNDKNCQRLFWSVWRSLECLCLT